MYYKLDLYKNQFIKPVFFFLIAFVYFIYYIRDDREVILHT